MPQQGWIRLGAGVAADGQEQRSPTWHRWRVPTETLCGLVIGHFDAHPVRIAPAAPKGPRCAECEAAAK